MSESEQDRAKRAVGEVDGEYVAYGRWDPPHDGLEPVNVAYVPLTSNKMQEYQKRMEGLSASKAMRLSVEIVCGQVRRWDARTVRGEECNPRNKLEVAGELDYNVVEGVCGIVMDSRRSQEAREALENFTKP